jgi:hypothetical protein
LALINRIAALVPPPRIHRHRNFGVLVPNSPLRPAVTARALVARPRCPPAASAQPTVAPARGPPLWEMPPAGRREIDPFGRRDPPACDEAGDRSGAREYGILGRMRTTIDLPDPLFLEAKTHAAEHGRTLKDFVADALQHRLPVPSRDRHFDSVPQLTRRGW